MDRIADALGVSTGVAVLVVVIAIVQLTLQIIALIDLARRPTVADGRKWVWLLVILLGNLIGPVLYLAIGRQADTPVEEQPAMAEQTPASSRASAAADLLYGPKKDR